MKANNKNKDLLKNKRPGFKVPENYFENFQVKIPDQEEDSFPKDTGFKAPDGYFNHLNEEILFNSSVISKETGYHTPKNYFKDFKVSPVEKSPKVVKINRGKISKMISMAVAASLFVFIGIKQFTKPANIVHVEDLSSAEIENWMNENYMSMNTYDISETYSDLELNNDDLFQSDEIEAYLIDKDIEDLLTDN